MNFSQLHKELLFPVMQGTSMTVIPSYVPIQTKQTSSHHLWLISVSEHETHAGKRMSKTDEGFFFFLSSLHFIILFLSIYGFELSETFNGLSKTKQYILNCMHGRQRGKRDGRETSEF